MRKNLKTSVPFRLQKAFNSLPGLREAYEMNSNYPSTGHCFIATFAASRLCTRVEGPGFSIQARARQRSRGVLAILSTSSIAGMCRLAERVGQERERYELRRIIAHNFRTIAHYSQLYCRPGGMEIPHRNHIRYSGGRRSTPIRRRKRVRSRRRLR